MSIEVNITASGMMPVDVLGTMADMYKADKTYEVIVDDKMHPDAKVFSFGINGRLGEYPTKTKIRLHGEEIQHLYNCQYKEPIIEESGPEKYKKVTGWRMVCRFSIVPTSWGALPDRAVLLDPTGTRTDANTAPVSEEKAEASEELKQKEIEAAAPAMKDMSIDDMLAEREKELSAMTMSNLRELAKERGTRTFGTKADVVDGLLKLEEKVLRGE